MESALWAALQDLVANDLRAAEPVSTTRRRVGILAVLVLAAAAFAIWRGSASPPPGPRSVLYLSSSGWLGVVADGRVTIAAVNPHEAYPIVVSAGGRLVSTAGGYERTGGLAFEQATPWLRPVQGTPPLPGRRCCWFDGASDGHSTLAVHRDVYGDDGTEVHRFGAGWSGGTLALRPGPGAYSGIAVTADGTWWLSTAEAGGGRLERWRHGRRLARTDGLPRLVALAADPADGTVWGIAEVEPLDRLTLVQFGADGRQLQTAVLAKSEASFLPRGAEFAAPGVP
jgi:hypothetical protein